VQQEVVLAMLAKEPSHGYELRARLRQALRPPGDEMNDRQVYVTLTRLEKACGLLLLEGIVLRLQADLRWLEACERNWIPRKKDRS
jgi:hypothetical protein